MGGAGWAVGGEGMHALSFALKRAHLRAVEIHKPLAKRFDLTPARFDVMVVLWQAGGTASQRDICEALGVSAPTVCKMAKAMEVRGLVSCERTGSAPDRRYRAVSLTRYGLDCIVGAIKAFLRVDDLRRVYDAVDEDGRAFVAKALGIVRRVGRGLWDRSRLDYLTDAPDAEAVAAAEEQTASVHATLLRLEAHGRARKVTERPTALVGPSADGSRKADGARDGATKTADDADPDPWIALFDARLAAAYKDATSAELELAAASPVGEAVPPPD